MKTLTEELSIDRLIEPQDVGTADITGAVYQSVQDSDRFRILASAGAVTAAKKLTVQAMQAQDAAGTGAKVLGAAVESVGAGGNAPAAVDMEFKSSDLDVAGGFLFVSVTLGIDENAKLGAAWLVRGRRRYQP